MSQLQFTVLSLNKVLKKQQLENFFFSVMAAEINHEPALLYYRNDVLVACQVFSVDGEKISRISNVLDPEKLAYLVKTN